MTETLLAWLTLYGVTALFLMLTVGSIGVPLPSTLILMVVGSIVEQGDLNFWTVIACGSAGAILGDQIGYWFARWAGRRVVRRITDKVGGTSNVERAHRFNARWGSTGIFLTRWLIGPLGPWVNLSCGLTEFKWSRFLFWGVLGEILWVVLYVSLGRIFSDRVEYLSELAGNLTWLIVGMLATSLLGWKLFKYFRDHETENRQPAP